MDRVHVAPGAGTISRALSFDERSERFKQLSIDHRRCEPGQISPVKDFGSLDQREHSRRSPIRAYRTAAPSAHADESHACSSTGPDAATRLWLDSLRGRKAHWELNSYPHVLHSLLENFYVDQIFHRSAGVHDDVNRIFRNWHCSGSRDTRPGGPSFCACPGGCLGEPFPRRPSLMDTRAAPARAILASAHC
jgi:hypothetical protein